MQDITFWFRETNKGERLHQQLPSQQNKCVVPISSDHIGTSGQHEGDGSY